MKKCKYCGANSPNDAAACGHCGAIEFENICSNCGTVFVGEFCSKCGVRAGVESRVCPVCGTSFVAAACPTCAMRAQGQPTLQQTIIFTNAPPTAPVAPPRRKSAFWLYVLAILMPYIGLWIFAFNDRFGKGAKIAMGCWGAFISVMFLSTITEDVAAGIIAMLICAVPTFFCFFNAFRKKK